MISEIILNRNVLLNNFKDIKSQLNLKLMKCYYKLLSKEGLKKNIGSYIQLTIIVIIRINYFIFICKGYNLLVDLMNNFAF